MTMLQLEIRQQLRIFKSIGLKRVPSKFFYSRSIQNRVLSLRVLPNVPSRVAISPFQIRSHKLTQWENFNRYRKYSRLPKSPFLLGLIAVSVGEDKNDAEHTRNSDDVANDVATREGDLENVGEDSLDDCSLTGLETFLEPILTCFRFFQLTLLFLPVILSFPLILFGPKMSALRSERRGALLWYKYLTWTMEIAGPSFIKVRNENEYLKLCFDHIFLYNIAYLIQY